MTEWGPIEKNLWLDNLLQGITGSTSEEVLALKEEIAEKYIEKLKTEKGEWLWSLIIGEGKSLKDYLVSKNIGDKVRDNIKGVFLWGLFTAVDQKSFEIDGVKYNSIFDYLKPMKEELDAANTKEALEELKDKILNWVTIVDDDNQQEQPQDTENTTDILPIYTKYKYLKVGGIVAKEDITYVEANAENIVEHLQTKGSLSKIEEIKDVDGNVVLECRWKTPYIHSKAASDLIWLSLLYYKKTWKKFLLESAYRTIDHQEELKEKNAATWVPTADPWYSWHNLWYSIDLSQETRYDVKIGGIAWLKKLAEMFDFHPISSEDWHFDYSEFVDKYYNDKEARLPEAQKLDDLFENEQEYRQAA